LLALSTAAALHGSCAQPTDESTTKQPVVYGEDDREDVYAFADQAWAAEAANFTAAMVPIDRVNETDPNNVALPTTTLQQSFGVCPDERFASQITAGFCSSTLVAPDTVVLAGHCINAGNCAQYAFVFDYYMTDATTLHPITHDDVYHCAQVLTQQVVGTGADFAVVRLDRPVVGRTPAVIATSSAEVPNGTRLIINGYPSGLPLKLEDGAAVRDSRASTLDFFVANLDTFGGNSGSGVFRADTHQMVGILVRGETDYVQDPAGCSRVNRCPDNGCRGEDSTYAFRAIESLCAAGPHSLCHCGDGTCDPATGETTATCPSDCGSQCGDNVCNGTESPITCPQDCGTCGNNACDNGETTTTCCTDCGCGAGDVCRANTCIPDPGPGDTCASALTLTAQGTQTVTGTTATAANDYRGGCVTNSTAPERVYTFTLPAAGAVSAQSTGYDTVLYLRRTCEDSTSELACNDDATPPGSLGSRIDANLQPGTYYLFVDGYAARSGNYTLTVTFPVVCADGDTDGDGTCNGADGCPNDPGKIDPGICGCGVADTDGDSDGTADCHDLCPADPAKTEPGVCGCGVADLDTDSDGTADCHDGCPMDATKTEPGVCGCGVADTDGDGDQTADCNDHCPMDASKVEPGACGCGVADTDTDSDATPDCNDHCPMDASKTEPGACGCGTADVDGDMDGTLDCNDHCPMDASKTEPGACGCGVADADADTDGTPDCNDACPNDPQNHCNEPPPPPPEEDGCGCRTDNRGSASGALLIGAVVLGLRRRRRAARA